MNTRLCILPALCLGGAALLLAPARSSRAFTVIGGSLDETQRDVRVYNNFVDATANNNTTPASQFPGQTGAELAIWKGFVEWGSRSHGNGSGDPLGGNTLGSGGANFDALWSGNTNGPGFPASNIVSAVASYFDPGVLAYCEVPISNGWRIIFVDSWTWDDGPAGIVDRWDIQGAMVHEYGHALGLGHSTDSAATMFPAGSAGQTSLRSIAADDIAGVQSIYGVASATKPTIDATVASAGTLTIYGTNFDATDNEVWFRSSADTSMFTADPIVRVTGVSSIGGGTVVSVTIPGTAGVGDVIVKKSGTGGAALSNAFPTDLVGTFGTILNITGITPTIIEALIPGTTETITLTGTRMNQTTAVLLDGSPIDPSRYTIVSASTITLDMPQAPTLGVHNLGVTNGVVTDNFAVTIVAPTTAKLQWGTGDALNVVDRDDGLDLIVAGHVGEMHVFIGSPNGPPVFKRFVLDLDKGSPLAYSRIYVIPASGWLADHISGLPDPALVGATWYAKSLVLVNIPIQEGNVQSISLVP